MARHSRTNVQSQNKNLKIIVVLLILLLASGLLSSILFISKDSSHYLEIINKHPVVTGVKGYASKKLGDTYRYIFDDGEEEEVEDKTEQNGGNKIRRENATLFSLVRNTDLQGMLSSIEYVETRFNKNYHYDWVFVNDKEFTEEFKEKIAAACSGEVKFAQIPHEYWSYPEWINQEKLLKLRKEMGKFVKYGASESYRHMCRFNSGFFYKMDVLQNYQYYWRVEPDIKFLCDITYDPFQVMRENKKIYGFNMAMPEFVKSIPTLWETSQKFFANNTDLISPENNMKFISDNDGDSYNLCHFWSNFEIADLSFFHSKAYNDFFNYLDQHGGFFYERWGDAPVHTIAASLLLRLDQLQYFDNTGYYHVPNQNCPPQLDIRRDLNCDCNPVKDFTWHKWSCVSKFFLLNKIPLPKGVVANHSKRDLSDDDQGLQDILLEIRTAEETRWRDEL